MNRKEFLETMGMVALIGCIGACGANDAGAAPKDVDFTINIDDAMYSQLKTVGQFLYKDKIIIARVSQGEFVALSQRCTHAGTTVSYENSQMRFHCPNHGSNFNTSGGVINGPANKGLQKYNTSLNGSNLRVFS